MAIKVLKKQEMLNQSQVDNVIAERDILANTSCPYVVRLYYAFKTQENLCMVRACYLGASSDVGSVLTASRRWSFSVEEIFARR